MVRVKCISMGKFVDCVDCIVCVGQDRDFQKIWVSIVLFLRTTGVVLGVI